MRYAPSALLQSISSGDGNSAENHFPTSPTEPPGMIGSHFPLSVNAACKAAEQGEEAVHCLDQGLLTERLYYGDCEDEETDDSSNFQSDTMEEELSGGE